MSLSNQSNPQQKTQMKEQLKHFLASEKKMIDDFAYSYIEDVIKKIDKNEPIVFDVESEKKLFEEKIMDAEDLKYYFSKTPYAEYNPNIENDSFVAERKEDTSKKAPMTEHEYDQKRLKIAEREENIRDALYVHEEFEKEID